MFAACLCIVLAILAGTDARKKTDPALRPVDCSRVQCAWPECKPGTYATTLKGNCCPSCEKCPPRLLPCPLLVCREIKYSQEDPCGCPTCALFTRPSQTTPTVTTLPPKTPTETSTTAQSPPTMTKPITPSHETALPTTANGTPNVCSLDVAPGPCRGRLRRIFYNTTSEQCEMFVYGGCRGNRNKFRTFTDCQRTCMSTTTAATTPKTTATPSDGPVIPTTATRDTECEISGQVFTVCGTACPAVCGEERPLFCTLQCVSGCQCPYGTILDRASAQCVTECPTAPPTTTTTTESTSPSSPSQPLLVESSPSTAPATPTKATGTDTTPTYPTKQPASTGAGSSPQPSTATEATTAPDICSLRKDKGSCTLRLRRFYYNVRRNRCKKFPYSGCGGNANRFNTYEDCQEACM